VVEGAGAADDELLLAGVGSGGVSNPGGSTSGNVGCKVALGADVDTTSRHSVQLRSKSASSLC
jgi:hypothetical protein